MWKTILLASLLLVLVGALAIQQRSLNALNRRLDALARPTPVTDKVIIMPAADGKKDAPVQPLPDQGLSLRLAALEGAVNELRRTSDFLMENGRAPLVDRMRDEMVRRLTDPTASEQERLRALRLLRQGGALNELAASAALNWLNTATNTDLRENILRQLEGVTNRSLQTPLLQLAVNDTDAEVREQAVDNLGRYVADPQVESALWSILRNETNPRVQREAANALARAPVTEERLAALEQRTLDPESPLDERLVALQALRRADAEIPDTMAALGQEAYASTDPAERARLFDAFDGFEDPALKVPLVYGLQDPNPEVRERAADALSGYRSDPAVVEWLRYVSENDNDPRVRREALRALASR